MKTTISIVLGLILCQSPSAWADVDYQGGIRETYITPIDYNYSSDHVAQIKREIFDAGFHSMVLHLRLAVDGKRGHIVYHPPHKTSRESLEIMISRIHQASGKVIFKPVLYEKPSLGTPSAITEMRSDDPQDLFTAYGQTLQLYQAIASRREASVFVVGMGMGQTLTSEFAPRWKALVMNLGKALNTRTDLALELSHSEDLARLEKWCEENPGSFYDALSGIRQIRFTLPLKEYIDPFTLTLDQDSMTKLIQNRYFRLAKLFPKQSIVLSNVMIPGCYAFSSDESEMECPAPAKGSLVDALAAQATIAREFIRKFKSLNQDMGNVIGGLEIIMSNTDYEPPFDGADRRFPYFNKEAWKAIKTELTPVMSGTVSTPFRSAKSAALGKSRFDLENQKTACIYFDEADERDEIGPIHARLLENVLGSFRSWRKERRSIALFQGGDLASCDTVFYIASNFSLVPPSDFYPEIGHFAQKKTVVWFNYKIDKLHAYYTGNRLSNPIAFDVPQIFQPLSLPTPLNTDPGFYRYFDYKGETFFKEAKFDQMTGRYMSSMELNQIRVLKSDQVAVKATARHSKNESVTPYVVTQNMGEGSFWYFADLPFSFIHYEDRYLIFCDLLWDILHETPPTTKPMALVRIEDVNAADEIEDLSWTVDYLAGARVPFSLAIIPYYSNLFHNPYEEQQHNTSIWEPGYKNREFVGFLQHAKALGANFIFHGVAHQSGDLISGYHGNSAADYEFWLYPENLPMPKDSANWFTRKLEMGEDALTAMGIRPAAWETPHYASSVLDAYILGKTFEWNYQRNIYFKSELVQDVELADGDHFFKCVSKECRDQRIQKLNALQVKVDYHASGAQFIPFIVYKDSYGQAIIPESLGMIDFPMYPKGTWRPMGTPEDLLRRAKKLKVVRGAVASFFWHPTVLRVDNIYYRTVPGSFDAVGGKQTLTKLIDGIRDLGYEFVSIGDCKIFPQQSCNESKE